MIYYYNKTDRSRTLRFNVVIRRRHFSSKIVSLWGLQLIRHRDVGGDTVWVIGCRLQTLMALEN